ncbi:MAG TPA: hypothetical protein VFX89_22885 [Gammaproteobacteria bacterium]|nr:hypothetical protein [Gammaproteobacteria bacterium]
MASRGRTFTVAIVAFAAAIASAPMSAQPALDAAANRQKQLIDSIERPQSTGGVFAEDLIGPLTELALSYQESGDRDLASVTIERTLQVLRANYGLYSLAQAPLIGIPYDGRRAGGYLPSGSDKAA